MLWKARRLLREGQVGEAAVLARRLLRAPGDLLSFAQELWEAGAQEDALALAIDEHLSEDRLVRVAEAATPTHPFGAITVYRRLVQVHIQARTPRHYEIATDYARRLRDLYLAMHDRGEWEAYVETPLVENVRRPSLASALRRLIREPDDSPGA